MSTERIIAELNNKYGEDKASKLLTYLDLVLERNQFINLTAVKDRDEAIVKHIEDSLAITELEEYKNAYKVIDVGTGAGFPGALLAITDPDKEFVLLDSTLKRLKVIDEFCTELAMTNVTTVHARAEEVNRKAPYAQSFDLCVSRAVASLDTLCGWCLPFVRKGGHAIAYKGENYNEEIKAAQKSLKKHSCNVKSIERVDSSSGEISGHVMLVIEKK